MDNVIYTFNVYWTDKMKADFLQRVILIHSYLYYELDSQKWTDSKFDKVSKQLVNIQNQHKEAWVKEHTQYGYAFYNFDGSTGFDLWYRLNEEDQKLIKQHALLMLDGRLKVVRKEK